MINKINLHSELNIRAKISVFLAVVACVFFTGYLFYLIKSGNFDFKETGRGSDRRFLVQIIFVNICVILLLYNRMVFIQITKDRILIRRFYAFKYKEYKFSEIKAIYPTSVWISTVGYDSTTIKFSNKVRLQLDSFFIKNQRELVTRFRYILNNY